MTLSDPEGRTLRSCGITLHLLECIELSTAAKNPSEILWLSQIGFEGISDQNQMDIPKYHIQKEHFSPTIKYLIQNLDNNLDRLFWSPSG